MKGTTYQEEMTVVNLYIPNVGVSNLIKQTILDLIAQIDPKTMIVGDNNPTLSPIDRSSSKKNQHRNSRIE
jgi:hypothetical protein